MVVAGAISIGASDDDQAEIDHKMEQFFALATAHSNEEALRLLAEEGFARAVDKDGHTPLIVAAATGNEELLLEVLKHPHDLEHRDAKGCTVVWLVAGRGHNSILERLLKLGAPAATPDHSGTTPLMVAVMARNHGAIPLLATAGAPVDEWDDGMTALHLAVLLKDLASVRALLETGADPTLRYKGNSALDMARKKGLGEVEKLLARVPARLTAATRIALGFLDWLFAAGHEVATKSLQSTSWPTRAVSLERVSALRSASRSIDQGRSGVTYSNASSGRTGTMPNIGVQNVTPGTAAVPIMAGFHNGAGSVAGDADLLSANVRRGVDLFGVSGDPNVVNTVSGKNAAASDIANGRIAWVDGVQVIGTLGGCTGTLNGWCLNNDGTVTDLTTGLLWLQSADCGGRATWFEPFIPSATTPAGAHTRASNLFDGSTAFNGSDCGLSDGSQRGDWRLPTLKELETLTPGPESVTPSLPRGFLGLQVDSYWSSTSHPASPSSASGSTSP